MHTTLTVLPGDLSPGCFSFIQDAIDSIPPDHTSPVTIRIAPGFYHEKLTLEKPNVTLLGLGASPADTVLSFDDCANDVLPDGSKRGTFRSYTLFVHAPDVTLRNLTVENASGDSAVCGQAIALYAECDRFTADSCRLLGHQDTLFTGPLPPEELQPGGFLSPTQLAPRVNGRQYYRNCYLCGDVDFIFGSATAFFENCEIESLHREPADTGSSVEGYVTAASTPEGQEYGYVFERCRFLGESCAPGSVYLGRPWRNFARTVLISCELGAHIHPAGFHDWNKRDARDTVFYAEYASAPMPDSRTPATSSDVYSTGCNDTFCRVFPNRAEFVCKLDAVQAAHFSKALVLSGDDGWKVPKTRDVLN